MSDRYRARRFTPIVDPNNYAAVAAALKAEKERSRLCGPGYEEIYAPQSNLERPRAQRCCYNRTTETLMIVMTDPGVGGRPKYTWIQYDGVTKDMWQQLKSTDSTNDFVTDMLAGVPWLETNYGLLPRTRGESFEVGFLDNL